MSAIEIIEQIKELPAIARAQSREFCKNLNFAHGRNLPSRREFGKLPSADNGAGDKNKNGRSENCGH